MFLEKTFTHFWLTPLFLYHQITFCKYFDRSVQEKWFPNLWTFTLLLMQITTAGFAQKFHRLSLKKERVRHELFYKPLSVFIDFVVSQWANEELQSPIKIFVQITSIIYNCWKARTSFHFFASRTAQIILNPNWDTVFSEWMRRWKLIIHLQLCIEIGPKELLKLSNVKQESSCYNKTFQLEKWAIVLHLISEHRCTKF